MTSNDGGAPGLDIGGAPVEHPDDARRHLTVAVARPRMIVVAGPRVRPDPRKPSVDLVRCSSCGSEGVRTICSRAHRTRQVVCGGDHARTSAASEQAEPSDALVKRDGHENASLSEGARK